MNNRTFRLFVSSTFSDFKEERDLLNNKIYPLIKQYCNKKGFEFQLVDLRWGIYNEAALNQKTLQICLEEVTRCIDFSPAPNFLAMIGERYGWVPLPSFIAPSEFNKIFDVLNTNDRATISEWYKLDLNEIGGQYYLKPRSDDYLDPISWEAKETQLKDILIAGATAAGLSEGDMIKYTASATEHEIINGILADSSLGPNAIVLLRNNHPHKEDNLEKIRSLRERICQHMSCANAVENIISLNYGENYQQLFVDNIIRSLTAKIDAEAERLSSHSKGGKNHQIENYYNNDTILFGNETPYKKLIEYLNDDSQQILFLTGESGSGKTTLLAKLLNEHSGNSTAVFYGKSQASSRLVSSLHLIIQSIRKIFNIDTPIRLTNKNIAETLFDTIYSIPHLDDVFLIVIDGLDMFPDAATLKENFLPLRLPLHVKLIVSSASQEVTNRFMRSGDKNIFIDHLSPRDFSDCFDSVLTRHHRCLADPAQSELIKSILAQGGSPLHAKLLANLSATWIYGENIGNIPLTAQEIALKYIEQSYINGSHHRDTVRYCMALIAIAPLGILESELLSVLFDFGSIRTHFQRESKHDYELNVMPLAIWSRLFFDLKDCLEVSYKNGDAVIQFSHNIFRVAILKKYSQYCVDAETVLLVYLKKHALESIRIAKTLLILLQSKNRFLDLASLLTNMEFLNFCIKHGEVLYLLDLLSFVMAAPMDLDLSNRISSIWACLSQHCHMLQYYTNEFYACAYQCGLISSPHPYIYPDTDAISNTDSYNYFPYGVYSKISSCPNSQLYAICDTCHVYICSSADMREKNSIFIAPTSANAEEIINTVWLDDVLILVQTNQEKSYVYDVSQTPPLLKLELQSSTKNTSVFYDKNESLLVYCTPNSVVSCTGLSQQNYTIDLPKNSLVCFDECDDKLIVYTTKNILVYDLHSGKLINKKAVAKKLSVHCKTDRPIHALGESKIFLYSQDLFTWFCIYNYNSREIQYIFPQDYSLVNNTIVGNEKVLFVYDGAIMSVDLANGSASVLSVAGLGAVSWAVRDHSVIVTTSDHKITEHELSSFEPTKNAFLCRHNLNSSPTGISYSLSRIIHELTNSFCHPTLKYSYIFSRLIDPNADVFAKDATFSGDSKPSLISIAKDGSLAIAYEHTDAIIIANNNIVLFEICDLKLGVDNNILELRFSDNSNYLLIWTNQFAEVFAIKSQKRILSKSLEKTPAISISFAEDNLLAIFCADGILYTFGLDEQNATLKRTYPGHDLIRSIDTSSLWAAYYLNPFSKTSDSIPIYNIFDKSHLDFSINPKQWTIPTRRYFGKSNWLLYHKGSFYLKGKKSLRFSDEGYQFEQCSYDTMLLSSSWLETYLTAKNDLSSQMFEYPTQNVILLVCKSLNSIILFNLDTMRIMQAYKVEEKIIGINMDDSMTRLTLYVDSYPYTRFFDIILP